jgi:hypothetical protein
MVNKNKSESEPEIELGKYHLMNNLAKFGYNFGKDRNIKSLQTDHDGWKVMTIAHINNFSIQVRLKCISKTSLSENYQMYL